MHYPIIHLVCLLIAVILFVLEFFPTTGRNLIALGLAFLALSFLVGCSTNPVTGKKELSPEAYKIILATASAEAHQLATDYLTNGKIDYKKDLISGALGQVRTVEGSANPVAATVLGQAVGNVITDPALKTAVTDAALKTVNQALAQGLTKASAIETGVSLLDAILQHYAPPAAAAP